MWPETQQEVELELDNLRQLVAAYQGAISRSVERPPDLIERSALATMLHSFYTGIENIFKRIALGVDGGLPSGTASHSELLAQISVPTPRRPAVISKALRSRLAAYLGFRHVFRHAYSFDLDWDKMRHLAWDSEATLDELQKELAAFFWDSRE